MKSFRSIVAFLLISFCYPVWAQPVVTSFSPASGPAGTSVTITGSNFNTTAASNIVFFGAVKATVTAASPGSLTVTVPVGATYQYISVSDISTGLTGYSLQKFTPTFTCGAPVYTGMFSPKVDFTTGNGSNYIAFADINGDGKQDILVSNITDNTVSILKNTSISGTVSFAAKVDFAVGTGPVALKTGDFDGDGLLDIATANSGGNNVSVLRNTSSVSTISFAARVDLALAASYQPGDIDVSDLNSDGKTDIVVTDNGTNKLSVFSNMSTAGAISFSPRMDVTAGTGAYYLIIGDVDGDARPDVAVTNFTASSISVFLNTSPSGGAISLAPKVDFAAGSYPRGIDIGDLDADGKMDLAFANWQNDSITVLKNTSVAGTVSFAPKASYRTGVTPYNVVMSDVDGDGQPDLSSCNYNSNTISCFRNISSGGSISLASRIDFATGTTPIYAGSADIDGDGRFDFVAVYNTNKVSVLKNIDLGTIVTSASTATICNGATVTIPITSNAPSTYTWIAADNPNTTGESTTPQTTDTLSNTIINTSSAVQTVTYTVTPTPVSGTCSGIPKVVTVTVNPALTMTSANSATITSGTTVSIPLTSTIAATYKWIAADNPNTTGESLTQQTTSTLSNTITNSSSVTQVVSYSVTPTSATCGTGTVQNVNVTVNVVPAISSFSPTFGPAGTTVTITGVNFNPLPANNSVYFGATRASVSAASSTSLTVTAPVGSSYQAISVTDVTSGLTAYSSKPFIQTFANCGAIYPTSFAPKMDIAAGTGPSGLVSADLDKDGKPDIAVLNNVSATFSVYLNTGSSGTVSLGAPADFTTGSAPYAMAAGDLDGDGLIDIAVTNGTANTFSVYRNTSTVGTISFAPKVDYVTNTLPQGLSISDFNGDGKPDVIVVDRSANKFSVFRSTSLPGAISFAAKVDLALVSTYYNVAMGDLNADGKTDLVFANNTTNTVSVWRNTSTVTSIFFNFVGDLAAGTGTYGIAVGDIDGDGKPDVAATNRTANTVSVFRNTGGAGITFAAKVDFACANLPTGISIGDMNGDGKADLAVAGNSSNVTSLYANTSASGSISFATRADVATGNGPFVMAIEDVDGDQKPDLISANNGAASISILKNQMDPTPYMTSAATDTISSGGVTNLVFTSSSACTYTWIAADNVNTTGESTTMRTTSSLIDTITNNAGVIQDISYTVTPTSTIGCGTGPSQTVTVTVRAKPPVITSFAPMSGPVGTTVTITGSNFYPVYSSNTVYFGAVRATVTGGTTSSLTVIVPVGTTYENISVTDMVNNLSGYSTQAFRVTFPCSAGVIDSSSFSPRVNFGTGTYSDPTNVALGDFDGDGLSDIAFTGDGSAIQGLSVLRNTSSSGTMSFAPFINYPHALGYQGITVRDFDGDGKLDIAVTDATPNAYIYRNTSTPGTISFASPLQYDASLDPFFLTSADLDADGKPELILANINGKVSVFHNTSNAGFLRFDPRQDFTAATDGKAIVASDIDGDGKIDVAITTYGSIVSVLRNTSTLDNISFAAAVTFPTGTLRAQDIAAGDIDGDNKPDLVIADGGVGSNPLGIFRNTSTPGVISFAAVISFPFTINNDIGYFSITDMDSDGKLDIVTTDYGTGKIDVFKNTSSPGSISLAGKIEYAAGAGTLDVVTGDLDGDMAPDIAAVNKYDYTVSVLRNNECAATPVAGVTITESTGTATVCQGNPLTFTASAVNGGTMPSYQWRINGLNVGINSPSYTSTALLNSDTVTCVMTSSLGAVLNNPAVSNAIVVTVNPTPILVITDPAPVCSPSTVDLSSPSITAGSTSGTISYWQDSTAGISLGSYYTAVDTSGTYYIRLDNAGCSDIQPVNVSVSNDCYVWPGDANNDFGVDNYDLLPVGLFYSQTGPPRAGIDNTWQAIAATDWGITESNGADIKHADCNGDGTIDDNDTLAINYNFSLAHAFIPDHSNDLRLTLPDLYYMTSSGSYNAGDWIDVEIWAGSAAIPVSSLYGIAFDIGYDASLVQPGTESLNYPASWLGTPGTDAITIARIDPLAGTAYAAITRTDHINASGYGKIADFKFQAKTSLTTPAIMHFITLNYMADNSAGSTLSFNTPVDSINVNPLSTGVEALRTTDEISIAPNPFTEQTVITFATEQKATTIKIMDVLGKEVKTIKFSGKKYVIEKGTMENGVYYLQIFDNGNKMINKKIIIQ
jgi:hypothetical protein